jgi:hypothetical protein
MTIKEKLLFSLIIFVVASIFISLISIEIYCWITYGGKPVSEVPAWALWFMYGGRRD